MAAKSLEIPIEIEWFRERQVIKKEMDNDKSRTEDSCGQDFVDTVEFLIYQPLFLF